jgi:hypothetical protein
MRRAVGSRRSCRTRSSPAMAATACRCIGRQDSADGRCRADHGRRRSDRRPDRPGACAGDRARTRWEATASVALMWDPTLPTSPTPSCRTTPRRRPPTRGHGARTCHAWDIGDVLHQSRARHRRHPWCAAGPRPGRRRPGTRSPVRGCTSRTILPTRAVGRPRRAVTVRGGRGHDDSVTLDLGPPRERPEDLALPLPVGLGWAVVRTPAPGSAATPLPIGLKKLAPSSHGGMARIQPPSRAVVEARRRFGRDPAADGLETRTRRGRDRVLVADTPVVPRLPPRRRGTERGEATPPPPVPTRRPARSAPAVAFARRGERTAVGSLRSGRVPDSSFHAGRQPGSPGADAHRAAPREDVTRGPSAWDRGRGARSGRSWDGHTRTAGRPGCDFLALFRQLAYSSVGKRDVHYHYAPPRHRPRGSGWVSGINRHGHPRHLAPPPQRRAPGPPHSTTAGQPNITGRHDHHPRATQEIARHRDTDTTPATSLPGNPVPWRVAPARTARPATATTPTNPVVRTVSSNRRPITPGPGTGDPAIIVMPRHDTPPGGTTVRPLPHPAWTPGARPPARSPGHPTPRGVDSPPPP